MIDFKEQFEKAQRAIREQRTSTLAKLTVLASSAVDGGHVIPVANNVGLNLPSGTTINEEGYGIVCAKAGSDPFALKVDLGKAGVFGPVYPGVEIRTKEKFDKIICYPWFSNTVPLAGALTAAGGYTEDANELTLVVLKTPEARYREPEGDGGFIFVRELEQAYNSTANIPSQFFDGISCRGARSVRVAIQADGAVTGGKIRWWHMPYGLAHWCLTDIEQTLPVGHDYVSPGELEVAFRGGRLFPELYQLTSSGGNPPDAMYLYVCGEGGDLYPGEV